MNEINVKDFIREAGRRLSDKNARSMALLHTGVTVGFALLVTVLQYVLELGIGNTSGLSGMGTRSILQTIQTVAQWANMILAPFWNLGFIYVAMLWARDQYARKEDLLTGFHRISPCIGLMLLRTVLAIAAVIISINLSSTIYMMTPASQPIADLAAEMNMDVEALRTYLNTMDGPKTIELLRSMIPMFVISAVLSAVLLIPVLYRFRLAEYVILNQKGVRALPAALISAMLMRRRCWQLFKLDLRLWWYYGLKTLCLLLCYLDMLLPTVGIAMPFEGTGAFFATYILYLAALLVVETAFRPRVETAYAGVYEAFVAMGPVQKKQMPAKPEDLPWEEQ